MKTTLCCALIASVGCGSAPPNVNQISKDVDKKAGDEARDTPVAAGTHPIPPLAGTVTCYGGTSDIEQASGKEFGLKSYMRHAWDAATSTLVEDSVTIMKGTPTRTETTMVVKDTAITVKGRYKGGGFEGKGTGTGAAPFTAWTTDTTMTGTKVTVHGEYKVDGGNLALVSTVRNNGADLMRFTIKMSTLDDAACKDAFSKFPPL